MNLRDWFEPSFSSRAKEIGLEWAATEYTFAELDARSNRMARALAARGLLKGDRLCVYLANSIEMLDLYLACVKSGLIFVPINILYRDREMTHILSDADPKLLVTAAEVPALLAEAASQSGDRLPDYGLGADDPAALVYTSGTTGVSKGAILTHNNFAINGRNLVEAWGITAADRLLLAPPLFHVHALGERLADDLQGRADLGVIAGGPSCVLLVFDRGKVRSKRRCGRCGHRDTPPFGS